MFTSWAMKHECATCEYWNGHRRINSDPRTIDYEGKGICEGFSHHRGQEVHGSTHVGGFSSCWTCKRGLKER